MTETAEIRWFLPGPLPDAVGAWFDAVASDARHASRTDRYLVPEGEAVGRKWREGRAEVKTRTHVGAEAVACGRAAGTPEHWCKETVAALPDAPALDVAKARRTCIVETSSASCMLEVSTVAVGGSSWWTVCLEAAAPTAEARERTLREACQRWLAHPDTPALPAEASRGYPAWLLERVA